MVSPVYLRLTVDEAVEIVEALRFKALAIKRGDFGPEGYEGEDKRWLKDLNRLADTIEGVI